LPSRICDTIYRPDHSRHLQSQPSKIAYDKTLIAKWSIGEVGYLTLATQDALSATESHEGTSRGIFLG